MSKLKARMPYTRYNSIAIILHWVMAFAIVAMVTSGLLMVYADLPPQLNFQMYQWHKSLGVLFLIAAVLRLFWRFVSKVPSLPARIKPSEKVMAKLGHWGLYGLMLLMPVSGWVMVSSSPYGLPTIVFGWFEWAHLPYMEGKSIIHSWSKTVHWLGAIALGLLIFAHVVAVVKHARKDNINLLKRMWWTTS